MPVTNRALLVNACCLYVAAYLSVISTHELGHAVVSAALGGRPILYNTSVHNTNEALSTTTLVLIAAAGPLVSLAQGAGLLSWVRHRRPGGCWGLFWLFMGVFGLINFLGYLMIAPLVSGGDTGQIAALLQEPTWLQWGVAGLAGLLLAAAIGRTGPLFRQLLPAESVPGAPTRVAGMRALLLWPWLVGSVGLVALVLPVPYPSVVANLVMSPMVLGRAFRTGVAAAPGAAPAAGLLQWQWLPVLAALLGAVGFKLLGQGLAL